MKVKVPVCSSKVVVAYISCVIHYVINIVVHKSYSTRTYILESYIIQHSYVHKFVRPNIKLVPSTRTSVLPVSYIEDIKIRKIVQEGEFFWLVSQ
jgi:hypothetical protein